MTDDRLDTKIRALVVELVDSTPAAPTWESIHAQLGTQPHRAPIETTHTAPAGRADDADPLGDLTDYARPEDRRRKPRWRPLAAGGGAVGILVGGAFAYASFIDNDGSATPEAAVEQFVDSVTAEDAIGAFESLPPSERGVLTDAARDLAAEADRLTLSDGLELSDVDGFDFEVQGLTLEPETLGEDVVAVHIDGTLVSQSTGAELPLGPAVLDNLGDENLAAFDGGVADLQRVFAEEDVFVVAIREDGGWHASAWYTLAEYIRRATDQPMPAFGTTAIQPVGAGSPEEAVRSFVIAVHSGDLGGAIALGLPGESRVLYDYGPIFLDDVQQSAAEQEMQFTLDDLQLAVEGEGDVRSVTVTSYAATTTDFIGTYRSSYADGCLHSSLTPTPGADWEGYDERTCRDEALAEDTLPLEWDLGVGSSYVVVQQDGRWYISPARTVANSVTSGLRLIPDANAADQLLAHSGVWALYSRVINLYGGVGAFPYPPGIVFNGEDCVAASVNENGETISEPCSFDAVGTPIDENGNPIEVPMTMVATSIVGEETDSGSGSDASSGSDSGSSSDSVSETTMGPPSSP